MIEVRCQTEDDTRAFAARLASVLRPGDTLVLAGGLDVDKPRNLAKTVTVE